MTASPAAPPIIPVLTPDPQLAEALARFLGQSPEPGMLEAIRTHLAEPAAGPPPRPGKVRPTAMALAGSAAPAPTTPRSTGYGFGTTFRPVSTAAPLPSRPFICEPRPPGKTDMPTEFDNPNIWALIAGIAGPLIAALLAFNHLAAHTQNDAMAGRSLLGSNSRITLSSVFFNLSLLAFIYLLTKPRHQPADRPLVRPHRPVPDGLLPHDLPDYDQLHPGRKSPSMAGGNPSAAGIRPPQPNRRRANGHSHGHHHLPDPK